MACPATLKWQKQRFALILTPGSTALELKQNVYELTGVLAARQKLMCKGGWKGALKDDAVLGTPTLKQGQRELTILLIGSADTAGEPANTPAAASRETVTFEEDISPAELEAARAAAAAGALQDAEGMIPALQEPPGIGRDDGKSEPFQYNHFVFGWPQKRIEATLAKRRQEGERRDEDGGGSVTGNDGERDDALLGMCAMQLGTELGKAFVTAVAVMADGTLLSGTDSGHIHMWRHAIRMLEVVHEPAPMSGAAPGPIEALVCLCAPATGSSPAAVQPQQQAHADGVSFVSGANGTVKLWNADAECLRTVSGMPGMTPCAVVAVYPQRIAIAWRQAHIFDPNAFRLPPQDAAQRRRREESERRQAEQQRVFGDAARTVTVTELTAHQHLASLASQTCELFPTPAPAPALTPTTTTPSAALTPPTGAHTHPTAALAAVVAVAAIGARGEGDLVCGDANGGLRIWARDLLRAGSWVAAGLIQLRLQDQARGERDGGGDHACGGEGCPAEPTGTAGLGVVCMEALPSLGSNVLAVSITATGVAAPPQRNADGAIMLDVPFVSAPAKRRSGAATAATGTCTPAVSRASPGSSVDLDSTGDRGSTGIQVAMHAVLVVRIDRRQPSVVALLAGHSDTVQCMCELPGRALATAGGKHDATVKVWRANQWEGASAHERSAADHTEARELECSHSGPVVLKQAAEELGEPGYVFAMAVLPDKKPGSRLFALAGAWYNRVKLVI